MQVQQIQDYLSQFSRALVEKAGNKNEPFWGKDGFDFADILDIVNPLQHLPVISKYYRELTHDEVSEGSRMFGGLMFGALSGGVNGLVAALTNSAVRHETQQDLGDYLITQAVNPVADELPDPVISESYENPFFAQVLELEQEQGSQSYQMIADEMELAKQKKNNRITDWGKV